MTFYLEVIERQANDLAETIDRLKDTYLSDKEVPLDTRWAAYLKVEKLLPNDEYSDGFIEELGWESVYDEFSMERHQTRKFSVIWESIQENLDCMTQDDPEDEDSYYQKYRELTTEQLNTWREAVLSSGYGSFTNDW